MAKATRRKKKPGGPFLAAAFFCEAIIEDKNDGAMTVVRIIDNINVLIDPKAPADFPSESNRLPVPVNGLISFKTGGSPGEHTVGIHIESPSGKSEKALEAKIDCSPQPFGGANLKLKTVIHLKQGGLFWYHIHLDGSKVASMPLQILIKRNDTPIALPAKPILKKTSKAGT